MHLISMAYKYSTFGTTYAPYTIQGKRRKVIKKELLAREPRILDIKGSVTISRCANVIKWLVLIALLCIWTVKPELWADLILWALIVSHTFTGLIRFNQHEFLRWPHLEKRRIKITTLKVMVFYIIMVGILIKMIIGDNLSPANLGIKNAINPYLCFVIGFAVDFLLQMSHWYSRKSQSLDGIIVNYRTFRTLLPKSRRGKYIVAITIVLLNPIYEETLFRGFLVNNLIILIGNIYLPILVGYVVFISLHLYQGIPTVLQQTFNYLFFICLLLSPLGLIGAIGFHFGADLFPFLCINDVIKNYRLKYRESRELKQTRTA
jgi:membrane protease YdiL (CAAX protease family)